MKNKPLILVINPGSTTTKLAVFKGDKLFKSAEIFHGAENAALEHRFKLAEKWAASNIELKSLSAVIGRGGLLKPVKSGVYKVDKKILSDLKKEKYGRHASNLGAIISDKFGRMLKIPSFIADPVTVDELSPEARITGLKEIKRTSIFHALNQKAAARKFALKAGKPYNKLKLVVAHLGGGITAGAHMNGNVIDVNNGLYEGPFSPERAGSLPTGQLLNLCFSKKFTKEQMLKKLAGKGGMAALLNTNDCRKIEKRIKKGDKKAGLIYRAMAYNISKYIGAMAAVLKGDVDAIILTGSLARSRMLVNMIKPVVSFIAPVHIYPGEDEMKALAGAALRALTGREKVKKY